MPPPIAVPARHAEDLPVLRHGGEERLDDVGDERLLREVDERVGRIQGLEQRAGVVPEDIGHVARRQARLDDVVAFGAPRPALDVDGHVGMQRHVGVGKRFGRSLVGLAIVDEVGQRDGTRPWAHLWLLELR